MKATQGENKMDWSANLKNLFTQRQIIKTSDNQTEINEAKKKEKEILSDSKLFDIDGKNNVNIEKNFFSDMKDALYDKLAKDINKNKDLKVSDMEEIEDRLRTLTSAEKEEVGNQIEKLQNRMVSNLTSQFFVTKETTSYKENAINGAIEIWEAQNKIDEWKVSENNPFNDKFENLLGKLEGRVTRTLAETYTEESIKDAKALKSADALVEKSDKDEDSYDKTKFTTGDDKLLYYNGEKFTGTYYKDEKYYQNGDVCNGVAYNGKYYDNGKPANGFYDNTSGSTTVGIFKVVDGQILYEDTVKVDVDGYNTVRYYYENYIIKDKTGKVVKDAVPSQIITYVGLVDTDNPDEGGKIGEIKTYEKGKLVSTKTYAYHTDGSYIEKIHYEDKKKEDESFRYTTTGERFNGNGVFGGILYKNNVKDTTTQIYGDRLYVNGEQAKGIGYFADPQTNKVILFKNGEKFNGIYSFDGKYYTDGELKEQTIVNDKVYRYGIPAQGVVKGEDNKYYYYVGGEKQSEVNEDFGKFAVERHIENITLSKNSNNEFIYSSFTGTQFIESSWRNVKYTDFTDKKNFKFEVFYEDKISIINTYEKGDLKAASYKIGNITTELNIDGNKDKNGFGIDYSLQYITIDGVTPGVQISNAIGNTLTEVFTYKLGTDGNYGQSGVKLVAGSISDIQAGKVLTEYPLSDKDKDISYEITDDGIKVTDNSLKVNNVTVVSVEQTYDVDDKGVVTNSGKVTFKEHSENGVSEIKEIKLNNGDNYEINGENIVITVPNKDGNGNIVSYTVTTYNKNGETVGTAATVTNREGTEKSFIERINLSVDKVQYIVPDKVSGKVTKIKFDGVEYNVTYDNDKIILKSADEKYEKQFINNGEKNIAIYEKAPTGINDSIAIVERNNAGVQTKYRLEDGNNNLISEYDYYDNGTLAKTITKDNDKQTTTEYATDGKTVVTVEIIEYKSNGEEVVRYAGPVSDNKITYKKEINKDGYNYIETNYANSKIVKSKTENKDGTKVETKEIYDINNNFTGKSKITYKSADSDEISIIDEFDENNNAIQKTEYRKDDKNNDIKVVEKYIRSSASDTVIQTSKDTYDNNNVIQSTVVYDNLNNNRITSTIYYENGIKAVEEKILTYENDVPKTSEVVEYMDGEIKAKTFSRTYSKYPDKYSDAIDGDVTEIGGVEIKQAQKDFAQSIGLTITDIAYNDDGSLKKLNGMRFNDNRTCVYKDWSVDSLGRYSYVEEITYAGNGTSSSEDDVTFISRVVNNVQTTGRIIVDNKSYPVNVNGSNVNDKLDASISTELIDDKAKSIYINDVLFDGVVRARVFTRKATPTANQKYDKTEFIALGSLEDLKDSSKIVPQIPLYDNSIVTENLVEITPTSGKIPVTINNKEAYNIELHSGETFKIIKDGDNVKYESSYKDGNQTITTTYTFDEEGNCSKTISSENNKITHITKADGTKAFMIGDAEFAAEGTTCTMNTAKTQITLKRESSATKAGFEFVYNVNTGEIESGQLKKGSKTINISSGALFYEFDNGYFAVKGASDTFYIYSPDLTEINETLQLTPEQLGTLNKALDAYNATQTTKITLSDITTKPEVTSSQVSFVKVSNANYTETVIYKSDNGTVSKLYTIGKQKFYVPIGATIAVANGKITISYKVNDNTTKTIELSKAGTSSTFYDKVKYNGGTEENITEEAAITIRDDGRIIT